MKGDFSWIDYRPAENYTGVLEQQGRVRLDRDGIAAQEIGRNLRNLMCRDTFGPGRDAVPAEANQSLRVTSASTDGNTVSITMQPGRAWVDGIPLLVPNAQTLDAPYLAPPLQPETDPSSIAAGIRDAVVLEVFEDSFSGFQEPTTLLEPALGGVDTTQRVKVFHRLALRRLADDEDCGTIGPSLLDDPSDIGRLTATPSPTIAIAGDCPVEAGGGYTGDGHRLICVEIAPQQPSGPRFTWSRFGGGLVGRGRFDPVASEISVSHNMPMIAAANVAGFHLQALAPEPGTGIWIVRFEATVSFTDGVLAVSDPIGSWPAAPGEDAFFRIWDGVESIGDFTAGPTDLADGIRLQFDPIVNGGENYRPGDRWQFTARAAGTSFDPSQWPQNALPMAVRYHRAALAILSWTSPPPDSLLAPAQIEDCRDTFPPLSDPHCCCTITVGDGRTTHGDTDSIEQALDRLSASGGQICLMPGVHEANAVIRDRADIRITGCGKHTRVTPRTGNREEPIFRVIDSECITIDSMDMISLSGTAILGESSDDDALRQLVIRDTRILACVRAIQIEGGTECVISRNRIRMLDKNGAGVAIYMTGEDGRIEDNDIGVVPASTTPVPPDDEDDDDTPDDPNDPCANPDLIYGNFGFFVGFVEFVFGFALSGIVPPPYRALGGIQIGSDAQRIGVIDNRILGGAGNGVTLGGTHLAPERPVPGGPDGNESEFQDISITSPVLAFQSTVIGPDDGAAAVGVTIRITPPSGAARTVTTDTQGRFEASMEAQSGVFRFEAVDPTIGVDSVTIGDTIAFGQGVLVIARLVLNRQRDTPDPRLGFLYDIRIEDNEISAMGLNGIGIPPTAEVIGRTPEPGPGTPGEETASPRFSIARATAVSPLLARLGHPVIGLTIRDNRIIGNLRTPFTAAMRDQARTMGFGGISLGVSENLRIAGNRIEQNGRRHIDPVCGIFMLMSEQCLITDNLIRDNGPFVDSDAELERGLRGGIAGIFLATGLDELNADNPTPTKPAVRVHDNVVQQPAGRALTVLAAGPASIGDNHLTAERTGTETADLMAGAVLVLSFSGVGNLPSGGCLVNNNQITLGANSNAFIAVALAAAEDLGLDGNQIDAMQTGFVAGDISVMLNTMVFAATARATDNRFRERALNAETSLQISLVTLTAQMNITAMNEADHCIFAFDQSAPARLVMEPNLVLDTTFCDDLNGAAAGAAATSPLGTAGLRNLNFQGGLGQSTGNSRVYETGLQSNLQSLNSFGTGQLQEAAEIKSNSRALWVNEVARLEGRASTRADLLAGAIERRDLQIRDSVRLAAAREIASTQPVVSEARGEVLIQGRVTDAGRLGVARRSVELVDANGNPVRGIRPVQTDETGQYLFALTREQLRANETLVNDGAAVVVTDAETGNRLATERFTVSDRAVLVPDLRIEASFARPILERPVRPSPVEPIQPVERPVLTRRERPAATSGRISPLIRQGRRDRLR